MTFQDTNVSFTSAQIVGPEIRNFLLQYFTEDEAERPNFVAGFHALRRVELRKLAEKFGIDLGNASRATDMVRVMETAWIQGRFPKPPSAEDVVIERAIERIMGDPDLKARLNQDAAPKKTFADSVMELSDPYKDMGWKDLVAEAKSRGINTYGIKREELESLLREDA